MACAISKLVKLLASALLVATMLSAHAQEESSTTVSGSLRANYFSSSRDLDSLRDLLAAAGELKLSQTLPRDQHIEIAARLSYEGRDGEDDYEARLLDAHWSAQWGITRWRIGQQKIRWGKADGINPTDFFTPIDYTQLLPLESDQHQSVLALRTDVFVGQSDDVSMVVSPDFTPTRLPWPSVSPVTVIDDPPSGSRRPQIGARWSHTGSTYDWSLSAFRGYSTVPVLSFLDSSTEGPRYERHYPASRGFGADLARNFDQWAFRAEIAYAHYDVEQGRQGVASNVFLVSGVDRSFDNWNVNVQGIVRYADEYRATLTAEHAAQQFAATMNGIVYQQLERLSTGATLRIAAHWLRETLQTEVLTVALFEPTNLLIRPLLTYRVSDQRTLTLGGEYYSGPEQSYFGLLERNRTVFMEFRQFF